jgi:hypothetical protein
MQEATMPTRRPVTPISEKGVPLKDAATDAQLIHGLMERLPNDLTASVTAVLGRSLSSDLRAALGAPEIIVTHFVQHAKESGRSLNEKELTRSVEAALRELGGDSAAAVEPAVVKEELEHAQHALVTHWLSLLITAWDLWGQPADGLALNPKNLLPDQETCPQREALRDTVISRSASSCHSPARLHGEANRSGCAASSRRAAECGKDASQAAIYIVSSQTSATACGSFGSDDTGKNPGRLFCFSKTIRSIFRRVAARSW